MARSRGSSGHFDGLTSCIKCRGRWRNTQWSHYLAGYDVTILESMRSEWTVSGRQLCHQKLSWTLRGAPWKQNQWKTWNCTNYESTPGDLTSGSFYMDFILTKDKSRLLFFNLSSSLSIFFFCCLSRDSPSTSFFFSTMAEIFWNQIELIDLMARMTVHFMFTYTFSFAFQFRLWVSGIFLYDRPTSTWHLLLEMLWISW